jgi:hypothetical protein
VRKQERGSPVKLYDFGILIIAALVAAAIAAAILTQVHH